MRHLSLIMAVLLMIFPAANARQNQSKIPASFFRHFNSEIPLIRVTPPDVAPLKAEDILRDGQGLLYRTGIIIPGVEVSEEMGIWDHTGEGEAVWRLKISAPGAKSIGVYFDHFELPEDGSFYAYNSDKTHIIGPYTRENSAMGDVFATAPVSGDEIILEFNGKKETADAFHILFRETAYMYRGAFGPKNASDYMSSASCQVNANCSEGSSWDNQRRSVVKIIVRDGNITGLCSGALINSANQDCTPYILTANHCGGGATVNNFKQWIFYFNFETPGCANPPSANNLDDQIITGCLKISNSADVSNVVASDFLLVLLRNRPASSFNAYMAGWSRSITPSLSGVGIHHPMGDVKKISTYTLPLTNSGWGGGNWGRHWGVIWAATANGFGVTEGGSSGSPIFNSGGQIVGQLSGGSSACNNTAGLDLYGKFSHSWDQTGTSDNRMLKPWLDKETSDPAVLAGKEVSSCAALALPTVEFVADNTTPSVGQTVNFTNQTSGTMDGFLWSITPATFTYTDGTDEKSENPKVIFNSTSFYSVTLHVYNAGGYGLRTRTAYIRPYSSVSVDEAVPAERPILFPNPSGNGRFTILSREENPIHRVRIADIAGKILMDKTQNTVPVFESENQSFPSGIYLIEITTTGGWFTEKWIVK